MRRDPHILVARYTDLEVRDMDPIPVSIMRGHWRAELYKACGRDGLGEVPGTRRVVVDQPNIITNIGLNQRGNTPTAMFLTHRIHCGEGTGTATVSDTALQTWTAVATVDNSGFTGTFFAHTSAPYFGSHQRKARFAAGFAGGAVNITELGISRDSTNTNMFSRVLTVDGGGSPAAVPIGADEAFDVFYTLENYPVHHAGDGSGNVDISGISYAYTIRAANITTAAAWARNIYGAQSGQGDTTSTPRVNTVYGSDAALGAITSSPSGTSTANVTSTTAGDGSYINDSFQRVITYNWTLAQGNVTGGIKAMLLTGRHGEFQLLFTPVIPKDGTKTLAFPLRTVWSRHV